ncbi:MAG: flavin reductase family protein [Firmicutes bacterium]|nr:flavin reductase family protein [Bacillota bacterium]
MVALPPGTRETNITRLIAPRPIALISTVSTDGAVNAAPFSFFTPVRYSPPTLCFSIGTKKHSSQHGYQPGLTEESPDLPKDTWRNLCDTNDFVMNFVSADLLEAVIVTNKRWPYGVDEIAKSGLGVEASTKIKAPRIREAKLALECVVAKTVDLGGQIVVFGDVVQVHADPQILDEDGKVNCLKADPLMHCFEDLFVKMGDSIRRTLDRYNF